MLEALRKLTNPSFFADGDAHAVWQRLRAEAPVAWTPEPDGPGFWSITRYRDGVDVFKDWATFSSAQGTTLEGNRWEADPAAGKMLALTDPPRHTHIRQVLVPFFSPRQANALEQDVRRYVKTLIARCSEMGTFDFVEEIASRLPVGVFFSIMNIPTEDWDSLLQIIIRTLSANESERCVADTDMLLYLSELASERRARPGDDVLSVIAAMTVGDSRLSTEEVILNFANLLSASIYTTRLATSGGLHALLEHRDQQNLLWNDQALIPTTIEEVVRWTSPALALYRTATKDAVLGRQKISRKDRVVVWIPSLNRDEDAFSCPNSFQVARNPNRHVGFGAGEHACIGGAFAKLELRVLFQELTTTWKTVEAAGAPHRLHSLVLQGIDSLPIRVTTH